LVHTFLSQPPSCLVFLFCCGEPLVGQGGTGKEVAFCSFAC
jgi:hypothetical protein